MAEVRLQKVLSRAGVASRRHGEKLIVEGRVRVNGTVVTELGTKVDPDRDEVMVDGRVVKAAAPRWIAFHKPRHCVTTRRDPQGRTTIYDLLPAELRPLFTVGRLDADSEGLLLLTNDGDAAHRLLHPRFGAERVYEVEVRGAPAPESLSRLRRGVPLEDGIARADRVERMRASRTGHARLRLVLHEGRNREVRRMMAVIGHPVERLRRVAYGPVSLGRLPAGAWRPLRPDEIRVLSERKRSAADPREERRRPEGGKAKGKKRGWRSGKETS